MESTLHFWSLELKTPWISFRIVRRVARLQNEVGTKDLCRVTKNAPIFQQFPRVTSIGSLPPETLGKSRGPPQNPAETPQNPRRDPAEPSERPPQSPRRGKFPRRASRRVVPLGWWPSGTLEDIFPEIVEKFRLISRHISLPKKKKSPTSFCRTAGRKNIRTHRIGANPEKSDLVNFRGPDSRKFSELCFLLFFQGKTDKMFPKPRFSKPTFGHSAGSTKLDRPYCKRFWE